MQIVQTSATLFLCEGGARTADCLGQMRSRYLDRCPIPRSSLPASPIPSETEGEEAIATADDRCPRTVRALHVTAHGSRSLSLHEEEARTGRAGEKERGRPPSVSTTLLEAQCRLFRPFLLTRTPRDQIIAIM